MARGRKRKAGKRYPSGRLIQAWDYGSDGVQRRRAIYQMPANDENKANADHTFDAIGRAWSAGLLEHPDRDAAAMRDVGRDYQALYWRIYGIGAHKDSLARYMPQGSSTPAEKERALEGALNNMIAGMSWVGTDARRAVDDLTLNVIETDHGPPWLDRLIWAKRKGIDPALADSNKMRLACYALAQIC